MRTYCDRLIAAMDRLHGVKGVAFAIGEAETEDMTSKNHYRGLGLILEDVIAMISSVVEAKGYLLEDKVGAKEEKPLKEVGSGKEGRVMANCEQETVEGQDIIPCCLEGCFAELYCLQRYAEECIEHQIESLDASLVLLLVTVTMEKVTYLDRKYRFKIHPDDEFFPEDLVKFFEANARA
jgi:hypothetical protein